MTHRRVSAGDVCAWAGVGVAVAPPPPPTNHPVPVLSPLRTFLLAQQERRTAWRKGVRANFVYVNEKRCARSPLYSHGLRRCAAIDLTLTTLHALAAQRVAPIDAPSSVRGLVLDYDRRLFSPTHPHFSHMSHPTFSHISHLNLVFQMVFFRPPIPFLPYVAPHFSHISHLNLAFDYARRYAASEVILEAFTTQIGKCRAPPPRLSTRHDPGETHAADLRQLALRSVSDAPLRRQQSVLVRQSLSFPDKRLIQWDCGKLQMLAKLLRQLHSGGHRCLIFTQEDICFLSQNLPTSTVMKNICFGVFSFTSNSLNEFISTSFNICFLSTPSSSSIYCHENICFGVFSFTFNSLNEFISTCFN